MFSSPGELSKSSFVKVSFFSRIRKLMAIKLRRFIYNPKPFPVREDGWTKRIGTWKFVYMYQYSIQSSSYSKFKKNGWPWLEFKGTMILCSKTLNICILNQGPSSPNLIKFKKRKFTFMDARLAMTYIIMGLNFLKKQSTCIMYKQLLVNFIGYKYKQS